MRSGAQDSNFLESRLLVVTDTLFKAPDFPQVEMITISFEGQALQVPSGISVAAAMLMAGVQEFRSTPVSGAPRAPYCMMGVCFDCLVEIDGKAARQSCMIEVHNGMNIRRQLGPAKLYGSQSEALP